MYLIGCTLLLLAGVMKALRPDDSARALAPLAPRHIRRFIGVHRLRRTIRIGALLEAGLGVAALLFPRPVTAALVAASYLVFTGVVIYVRSQGGALTSCGCFGTPDGPATLLHAAVDLIVAVAAVAVAINPPTGGTIVAVLAHQPLRGIPLLIASGVGVWLTYLTLSLRSALQAARFAGSSAVGR